MRSTSESDSPPKFSSLSLVRSATANATELEKLSYCSPSGSATAFHPGWSRLHGTHQAAVAQTQTNGAVASIRTERKSSAETIIGGDTRSGADEIAASAGKGECPLEVVGALQAEATVAMPSAKNTSARFVASAGSVST